MFNTDVSAWSGVWSRLCVVFSWMGSHGCGEPQEFSEDVNVEVFLKMCFSRMMLVGTILSFRRSRDLSAVGVETNCLIFLLILGGSAAKGEEGAGGGGGGGGGEGTGPDRGSGIFWEDSGEGSAGGGGPQSAQASASPHPRRSAQDEGHQAAVHRRGRCLL